MRQTVRYRGVRRSADYRTVGRSSTEWSNMEKFDNLAEYSRSGVDRRDRRESALRECYRRVLYSPSQSNDSEYENLVIMTIKSWGPMVGAHMADEAVDTVHNERS